MATRRRVLSVQTPLLGNKTHGELLRRLLAESSRVEFRSFWGDEEQIAHERSLIGRLVYRLCFTLSSKAFVRERNADFYALRYELGASYWARRLLRRELENFRPDVMHLHTQGLALASLNDIKRIPTVISGDMTSHRTAEQFTKAGWRWTHAPHHALEGVVFRNAAALVPLSDYAARSMIDHYDVDPAKVTVIPGGVDLTGIGDIGAHRSLGHNSVQRILFVGGEFQRKGGPDLVAAFLRAFGNDERVELHLVTHGPPRIARHPRIFVHTGVAAYTPQWRDLYERANLLALPTHHEAYGLVYLEAGAARLPVIGSKVGAGSELIVEGETGFLIEPGEIDALASRLKRLINDRALALRLGSAARARVERDFDAAKNARRLEQLFIDVSAKLGSPL